MRYAGSFLRWLLSFRPHRPTTPPMPWSEINHQWAARAADAATVTYGPSHPNYVKESA